ncbi:MAG: RHS repeat-associated core domain-containing protein, partial [Faecousia sp.]
YGYTYDALGNIATYTQGGTAYTYTYDDLGQLLTATGGGKAYAYTYDLGGNILTVSDGATSHTYTYGDSQWADLLTAFDGQSITYDASGNPLSYYNGTRYTFTWAEGRRLVSAVKGNSTYTYAYDSDGLRVSKTVNGVKHEYFYASGKLLRETYGNVTMDFLYNNNGYPYALKYNGTTYYYITNLQGDVLSLINASGSTVASYTYDPYGKVLTATGTMAETNPLRYRGYYYDTETSLYYLQSRYYDPTICRFINADSFASTGQGILGHNMFAYCGNNPVNRRDDSGHFWELVALIGGLIVLLTGCEDSTSSNYGAASDYVDIPAAPKYNSEKELRENNPNCYSYAIGIYDRSYDPGEISGYLYDLSVDSVAMCVALDLQKLGGSVRKIEGADSPIKNNEYRIALRVSDIVYTRDIVWDYHFMVQTSSGQWAEKHGPSGATVLHEYGTPDTISWDCGSYTNFYTSKIIYLAITPPDRR